ncbi:hypothetical protein H112_04990 [Trichophyton rubrum D6]|uniref:Uncharacterized protein n=3 Tax=Trichophyton TaxID=5550 RepID=A0A080WLG3_TRIRC|nr:uncharacterized protein TERG_11892 [Trichophyton rubrum CBS 118892]EZF22072.1 hypothetical protein H100_05013 [Trichophyton rubrum MR850]EZF41114.1 hypothetical protein H102_04999 [Trichophyton rubrum CBS 100081]EZF51761.1 hypothetical protein H103_05001 [Trichophyton rubrum CBS 288.86]EZF62376.1 hypothetical protein H104_04994 [Trichophyton rubrum CBS 289.86]EZF72736.1 hypothetical protein H105_05019 [Trichophyton soudanense CBS 452.61]EZF83675.1 hypothetical protein H110_04999 [Trichophy
MRETPVLVSNIQLRRGIGRLSVYRIEIMKSPIPCALYRQRGRRHFSHLSASRALKEFWPSDPWSSRLPYIAPLKQVHGVGKRLACGPQYHPLRPYHFGSSRSIWRTNRDVKIGGKSQ